MSLQHIIIALSLLSPAFCASMDTDIILTLQDIFPEDQFINFKHKKYHEIDKNFEQSFGYKTPDKLVKQIDCPKYKVLAQSQVETKDHTIYDIYRFSYAEKININETLKNNKKVQHIINEKIAFDNKKKLLEQQVAQQEVENKKLKEEKAALQKKVAEQKRNISQKAHINTQKKKNPTPPKNQNNQPAVQNNSNISEVQQRLNIKRMLFKRYKVKTEAQLKQKLAEQCDDEECHCLYYKISPSCSWGYCSETNALIIDIDSSSDSSCSDEFSID